MGGRGGWHKQSVSVGYTVSVSTKVFMCQEAKIEGASASCIDKPDGAFSFFPFRMSPLPPHCFGCFVLFLLAFSGNGTRVAGSIIDPYLPRDLESVLHTRTPIALVFCCLLLSTLVGPLL
jgi:hypothetical protein